MIKICMDDTAEQSDQQFALEALPAIVFTMHAQIIYWDNDWSTGQQSDASG